MLNFLVIGDWGRKGTPEQRAVGAAMAHIAETLQSQFVITTGDNFYDDGVTSVDDPHWQESFEDVYTFAALQTPWHVALGNHDYRGNVQAQIDYSQKSRRWRLPERYYALEALIDEATPAQFIFLDTSPFLERYHDGSVETMAAVREQDPTRQLQWLEATLAASEAPWKVVIGHHPIYSGSPFHGGAVELQEQVLPILLEYGVQVYLCGHEHDLQHLGTPALHCIVSGGGAEYRVTGTIPYSIFSEGTLGFAAISLTADSLWLGFYDAAAQLLYQTAIPQSCAAMVAIPTALPQSCPLPWRHRLVS